MANRIRNNHVPSQGEQQSHSNSLDTQIGIPTPKLHLKLYFISQCPRHSRNQRRANAKPNRRALKRPRLPADLPGFPRH